jgi:hypothetical protein
MITMHRVVQKIIPLIQLARSQELLEVLAFGIFKLLSVSKVVRFLHSEIRQATVLWNHMSKVDSLMCKFSGARFETERLLQLDSSLLLTPRAKEIFANVANILDNNGDTTFVHRRSVSETISKLLVLILLQFHEDTLAIVQKEHVDNRPDVLRAKMALLNIQHRMQREANYMEELRSLIALAEENPGKGNPSTLQLKRSFAIGLYLDEKHSLTLDVAKDILAFVQAPDPMWFEMNELAIGCYKALGDTVRVSKLFEEQDRVVEGLRKDSRQIHPIEDQRGDEKEDFRRKLSQVEELFPQLSKLVYEVIFEVGKKDQGIDLLGPGTVAEHQNPVETSKDSQTEAENYKEILPAKLNEILEVAAATKIQFRNFFTNLPILSNAIDTLEKLRDNLAFVLLERGAKLLGLKVRSRSDST